MENDLNTWLETTKKKGYALTTLTKKVYELPLNLQRALKGSTGRDKARLLWTEWLNPTEKFYEGLNIPVPMYFKNAIPPTNGSTPPIFEFYKVNTDRKWVYMRRKGDTHEGSAWTYQSINNYFELGAYEAIDPSPETLKKVFPDLGPNVCRAKDIKHLNQKENTYPAIYSFNMKGSTIYVDGGVTCNCQLSIIGPMNTLVSHLKEPKEFQIQLKEIYKKVRKRIILCDVKDDYANQVISKLPKANIISHTKYTSTNNSAMNIILINVETL